MFGFDFLSFQCVNMIGVGNTQLVVKYLNKKISVEVLVKNCDAC